MIYHHEVADLLARQNPAHREGELPDYLLTQLEETGPLPEQEPLQALTEMTPVGKVPLPELPHDYFLCHPDYEPHCWQPKSVAHSWH